ncbi:MAG TPA: hypothetical protein VGG12_00850 [Methylovirgula sp.]
MHALSAQSGNRAQLLGRTGLAVCLCATGLLLAGCQSFGPPDITGSIGTPQTPPDSAQALADYTNQLGANYEANPNDRNLTIRYAEALRKQARYAQAVAVLQHFTIQHPKDLPMLGAYGKALVDDGRLQEAADVLPQAHTPENPDWTILSAQGTVADQLGDHVQAQEYYQAALKIVPNQPDVLSNLGLSYALSQQLPLAQTTIELAAAQPNAGPRVRQNLALVLALEGKFDDAQRVAERDEQPLQAAENVAAIRQMIAQSDTWNQIRAVDAKPSHRLAARHTNRSFASRNQSQQPATYEPAPATINRPTAAASASNE